MLPATSSGAGAVVGDDTEVTTEGGKDATGNRWWDANDGVAKNTIGESIKELDTARTTLRSESQTLSTNLSTITIRQDFTKGMINTLEDGAAELTNADMNQEGANMLMLQTRQSLGTTSLSLASQAAQSVLRLF
jgi:flagellin